MRSGKIENKKYFDGEDRFTEVLDLHVYRVTFKKSGLGDNVEELIGAKNICHLLNCIDRGHHNGTKISYSGEIKKIEEVAYMPITFINAEMEKVRNEQ